MKNSLLIITLFVSVFSFSQGLILDKKEFAKTKELEIENVQGYSAEALPASISYRKYTPLIQDQEQLSTCVGWAVGYAQLSTQQNLQMGLTNSNQKFCRAMDPFFVYGNIRSYDDQWCQNGTRISDAMNTLLNKGTKPYIWDPWLTCNTTLIYDEFTTTLASIYRINDYFAINTDDIVRNVKEALNYKLIVSVGVNLTESFNAGSAATYGLWAPAANEKATGGHAMCVVGYDDAKYGGAFEVMNSWGSAYGDKGFVWIKYADFKKYVMEAYAIETTDFQKGDCSMGDCYSGYSRFTFKDGIVYEGIIAEGYLDSYGSLTYPNGDFYVGGMNKGRKHGNGVYFDANLGNYFNVVFNNDVYVKGSEKQGYASDEDGEKIERLLEVLVSINPGKKVAVDSEEQDAFFDKMEIPDEPLVVIQDK
jgi:hypothetical protein